MKAKNIKSVLRRKFVSWLESITDEALREAVKRDGLITGGSIASMLLGEPANDFDVYFKTRATVKAVAEYYVALFKQNPPTRFKAGGAVDIQVQDCGERIKIMVQSAGIAGEGGSEEYQYFEQVEGDAESQQFVDATVSDAVAAEAKDKAKYRPVFLTSNAISLSDRMQLVIRFWGQPDEIHANYDFVHCTCSWDAATGELKLPPAALESMLARDLRYLGSKYPLCSFIRTRKFIKRGWTINAGQYVKMAWDLNELDLTRIEVLEDQMVGVDAAYFYQVIKLLRKRSGDAVDGAYLIEVIDKVF